MIETHIPWLTAIVLLPLLAALAIPFLPDPDGKRIRWYALGVGLADFVLMCFAFWKHYDPNQATFQLVEKYTWIPQLGISWAVAERQNFGTLSQNFGTLLKATPGRGENRQEMGG
jgi:NAD(P)H-quinone oxidoreductase subunit 4